MSGIQLELQENFAEVGRWVRTVYRDQVPFATKEAVNATAIDFQRAEWAHMRNVFTIRNEPFLRSAAKIKPFATKRKPEAKVSVSSPGGGARSDVFGKFEMGGVKRPTGGRSIAIPAADVKRTIRGRISKGQRPRELIRRHHLKPVGRRVFARKGTGVWKGTGRVFMIRVSGGRGWILQRVGEGPGSQLKTLYRFRPSVRIPADLDFVAIAEKTVRDGFAENFAKAFDRAIRTARRTQIG